MERIARERGDRRGRNGERENERASFSSNLSLGVYSDGKLLIKSGACFSFAIRFLSSVECYKHPVSSIPAGHGK